MTPPLCRRGHDSWRTRGDGRLCCSACEGLMRKLRKKRKTRNLTSLKFAVAELKTEGRIVDYSDPMA